MAIRSIRHGGLRRWFVHGDASKLHPAHAERIKQILDALDDASPLDDLAEPTYRLHPLKGDRRGQWSVRVDRIWRIVFRVTGEDVFEVDLIDYHYEEPMNESTENVPYDAWLRRNPPHPGRHIYHGCMEAVEGVSEGVSVSDAARKLGVSRVTLSRVLNGRQSISISLALKLEAAGWGKADVWLRRQARYDLARERNRIGQWPAEPGVKAEAA